VASTVINNCYSNGNIVAKPTSGSGAFTGTSAGTYSGDFWNSDLTTLTTDTGASNNAQVTSLKTEDMDNSSNYIDSSWDKNLWVLDDNSLPHFYWQDTHNFTNIQLDGTNSAKSVYQLDTAMDFGACNIDFSTEQSSRDTMDKLQKVLDNLLKKQSKIGSSVNTLTSIQSRLDTQKIALTSAKSVIIDADYAKETATMLRSQVLQNMSVSLMSQMKEMNKNMILKLLGA
jgi:flagellin